MNRSEKQQLIDELHKELEKAPNAVLLDFKGLSVPAAWEGRYVKSFAVWWTMGAGVRGDRASVGGHS